jgi:transcriptional antiterminator NusG
VSDEPNKLADEATDDYAVAGSDDALAGEPPIGDAFDAPAANGDAAEAATETDASAEELAAHRDDTDVETSSIEEPIADEAEAYEQAEDAVSDEQVEEIEQADEAADEDSGKGPVYLAPPEDEEIHMDWYILKVQSNRERSIAEALERKIKIEGLDKFFDQVIVPTEKVTEFKGGKKKVVERKLYPGYIVVHMHINDDTWFAVRETSGVGDFTGAGGKPTPMLPHEVARIVQTETEETEEAPKLDIRFKAGDKVKVKEGNFESFEGEVGTIDEASGRVTVMINIFGRSTPVELEYWQIEAM